MQLIRAEVIPIRLDLKQPLQIAGIPRLDHITAIFVRIDTQQGATAWGGAIAHPDLTDEEPEAVIRLCRDCADLVPDLHPTNFEFSLAELEPYTRFSPAASCAFSTAFFDLLGLASGFPLYGLLGGYRNRIQTALTIPLGTLDEAFNQALNAADAGFRVLKIQGGLDAEEEIRRVQAIRRALPTLTLRLDADGGYDVRQSLEV